MVNINTLSSVNEENTVDSVTKNRTNSTDSAAVSTSSYGPQSAATNVSTLAQQLSEAAKRAEERDSTLSRDELAEKAISIGEKLGGTSYVANRDKYDAEVPKTNDPSLLARAKQATEFAHGKGANPFKGMSRDQLALITYDESGTFTVNERKAARLESYEQESAWRKQVVAKAIDAYNHTGSIFGEGVGSELLAHYKSLPAIEQSTYPKDYETQLKIQIAKVGEKNPDQQSAPDSYTALLKSWSEAPPEKGLSDLASLTTMTNTSDTRISSVDSNNSNTSISQNTQ